jgi:UDP-N-acetyl-D-mannosaminuronic acid transferase (WecB/TagA/CpsF family)
MIPPVRILGLDFFQGTVAESVSAVRAGGLLMAPSGPGLADLPVDPVYHAAVASADVRLLDSGLLAWLWELEHHQKLSRISGYLFLAEFLRLPELAAPESSIWVAPSAASATRTQTWMTQNLGHTAPPEAWYVAPQYPADIVEDEALLALIRSRRPKFVFICVGSGPQEKLGAWLKPRLDFRPAILCTGAAIAFLTGEQARIPAWADRARLGWLARCLQDPRRFVPRYWRARRLVSLYRRWGDRAPPASAIQR